MRRRTLLFAAAFVLCIVVGDSVYGQGAGRIRLVFDQAHGEQPPPSQLHTLAQKLGLELETSAEPITAKILDGARILYVRAPSREFTTGEAQAVVTFVKDGGSLLLVYRQV